MEIWKKYFAIISLKLFITEAIYLNDGNINQYFVITKNILELSQIICTFKGNQINLLIENDVTNNFLDNLMFLIFTSTMCTLTPILLVR